MRLLINTQLQLGAVGAAFQRNRFNALLGGTVRISSIGVPNFIGGHEDCLLVFERATNGVLQFGRIPSDDFLK
jgi:hypothetical protein